jgi:hypothetical protein
MKRLLHTLAIGSNLAILLLAGSIGTTHAQIPERRVGVHFAQGAPRIDVSIADFASDPETRRKLMSGLPQTLQLSAFAYIEGREEPIAATARQCRIAYDLWEERFRVQVTTEASARTISVRSIDEVVAQCLVVDRLVVGAPNAWTGVRGRRAYFGVLVELNPLTADTVQRIRRWLARPQRGTVDSDSFFGSFVSLFVNPQIGAAERALRFRSQRLEVP